MNINKELIKNNFEKDGYAAVKPLFDKEKIDEINNELNRSIIECVPKMPDNKVYYEDKSDKSSIKQLFKMFLYDEYFKNLIEPSVIRKLAEEVLGEKVRADNLQYFNKPPGIGKPTPPHQDGYYWHLKEPKAVTCWLALEPVDEENGYNTNIGSVSIYTKIFC